MWISHCATEDVIERARQANFKLKFPEHRRDLEKALSESLDEQALYKESKFYGSGSGFIHSGLHETAMYALRAHPKVAEHLSRTVRRELKNSALRVLHIFLEYHLSLLKAIRDGQAHDIDTPDAILATTSSIQNLASRYRSETREAKQSDSTNQREDGKQEKPSVESRIEAHVTMLDFTGSSRSRGRHSCQMVPSMLP